MIEAFDKKLDQLYDFTKCRCEIKPCSVKPPCLDPRTGEKCVQEAHITCTCVREERLPGMELLFIHKQRQKVGEVGGMQIGAPDYPESHRQTKYQDINMLGEQRKKARLDKSAAEALELEERTRSERIEETPTEVHKDDEKHSNDSNSKYLSKRNTISITGLASTALRYEVQGCIFAVFCEFISVLL